MKMLEGSYAQEKQKVRLKAEKFRLKELKENERIMMLNTSGMDKDQKIFYDGLKRKSLQNKDQVVRWVEMMLVMSCFNFLLVVTYCRPFFCL